MSHEKLLTRQSLAASSKKTIPLVVVLNDIRSLHNVGAIFRTADGVGVEKIWLCGITGMPPDVKITKTALGAEDSVAWEYARDAAECIKQLRNTGYEIVFLEQTEQSVSHDMFVPDGPVCLVIGNEVGGISDALLSLGNCAIEIEMVGKKNSLNVSVAFGIAAYHVRRCFRDNKTV